jgi:hypothetical protein
VENFCKENIIIENNFNEGANISIYGNKWGLGLSFLSGIVSGKSMYISSKQKLIITIHSCPCTYLTIDTIRVKSIVMY